MIKLRDSRKDKLTVREKHMQCTPQTTACTSVGTVCTAVSRGISARTGHMSL